MSFTKKQEMFRTAAVTWSTENNKDLSSVSKTDLSEIADSVDMAFPHWITRVPTYKVGRGTWFVPVDDNTASTVKAKAPVKVESGSPESAGKADDSVVISADEIVKAAVVDDRPTTVEMTKGTTSVVTNVPDKDPLFVPFGNFSDVESIFKSNMFYPVYVTGLSGNGKTFMIEQAAAKASRELFRVNITVETDEDDLLGGFRLVNGETVWSTGQ